MTRGDEIRAMSDDELVVFITDIQVDAHDFAIKSWCLCERQESDEPEDIHDLVRYPLSPSEWAEWLQQPSDDKLPLICLFGYRSHRQSKDHTEVE